MKKRPNILFLMSDEHRADVTGFEGNTVIKTPILDKLASDGVIFENCYTPSPICVPARQAMMSGKTCKNCGCLKYGDDLEPFSNTFAKQLSKFGYQTVACGKLHHCGQDQMQGWTRRINGDIQVNGPYLELDDEYKRFVNSQPKKPGTKWSDTKEVARAGISDRVHFDDNVMFGALDFIERNFRDCAYDRTNQDQPLLLKISLTKPHYPYFSKREYFEYYLNRVKAYTNEEVFDHPFLSTRQVKVGGDIIERDLVRATAAYYGMIEELDSQYGIILDALESVGQDLDDWLIIYTSDHGEMLGQHGIWEKQKFFEASARVPLVIRAPKDFKAGKVSENVNLCDLYATLCDYAGIPTPEGLDSRSLVPLLNGETENWDNMSISHYTYPGGHNLMIKKDDLKYQYYGKDIPEVLFDLKVNPEETINFMNDEKYATAVAQFREMLPIYHCEEI